MLAVLLVASGCGGGTTTATSQAQVLRPEPLSLNFSPQNLSTGGQSTTVTLVNTSRMPARVTSVSAIPYPIFRVVTPGKAAVIQPGQGLKLQVNFSPSQHGLYAGWLTVMGEVAYQLPATDGASRRTFTQPFSVGVPVNGRALDSSNKVPNNNPAWIKISPTSATVTSSQTVQFQASSNGHSLGAVTWSAALGTITASGVYTSPRVSSQTVDTVAVSSVSNPNLYAVASLVVNPPITVPTCQSNCGPVPVVSSGPAYYLSPSGNDSNAGTQAAPWKTFAHAIPALRPGMSLLLLDGTYNNSAGTGLPKIDCAANAVNGTASAPITLAALNERRAFIRGDGSASPLQLQNCSYWHITGLHLENGDFPSEPDGNGNSGASVIYLYNDNHVTVNRNILARDNRYFNSMLILGYNTSTTTMEENEFYYFHRHAINVSYGGYNVFRRNYFNSRFYADLPGCQMSPPPGVPRCSELSALDRGDSAISLYPDHDSIIENNVGENNEDLMDIEDAFAPYAGDNEKFYGNISLNDVYGILDKARGNADAYTAHNVLYQDVIIVNPISVAAYWRSPGSASCKRCSFINVSNNPVSNFIADQDPTAVAGGSYSVNVQNSLSVGATAAGAYGFFVNTSSGTWNTTLNYLVASQNNINFSPQPQNGSTQTPQLGSCLAWVPAGSPLKGAGSNGSDIGASVLYQYVNGTLTSTRLWDPTTGQFPHGATVTGLNDVAGASAFDVSTRLHVNTTGCPFPSGY